jgi:hypothetical protein
MLQKIKIFILLITFTFLSVSFVFLYGGNSKVYASSSSSVTCGNLAPAVTYGYSSVVTDSTSNSGFGTNGTIGLQQWSNKLGWQGGQRIATLHMTTNGNISQPTLESYSCSVGGGNVTSIGIPSNTSTLEYIAYSIPYTNNFVAYVDAIPTSKPLSACGSSSGASYASCVSCLSKNSNNVYTDFGCVTATPSGFINFIYAFLLTIAVMIDLVIFIVSGYLIMTSNGDPDKINRGKSLFKNAIIGLILIIFAIVLLQLIGSIFGISQL